MPKLPNPPYGYYRFLRMFTRKGRAHNRRVDHLHRNQPKAEERPSDLREEAARLLIEADRLRAKATHLSERADRLERKAERLERQS